MLWPSFELVLKAVKGGADFNTAGSNILFSLIHGSNDAFGVEVLELLLLSALPSHTSDRYDLTTLIFGPATRGILITYADSPNNLLTFSNQFMEDKIGAIIFQSESLAST